MSSTIILKPVCYKKHLFQNKKIKTFKYKKNIVSSKLNFIKNRIKNDNKYLYKMGTECLNDTLMISLLHYQNNTLFSFVYNSQLLISLTNDITILTLMTQDDSEKPANFFAKGNFTIKDRFTSVINKSIILGIIGFFTGFIGAIILKDPLILKNAFIWMSFLSLSSNIRYQLVSGIERLYDHYMFISVLRFLNNYAGAASFVWWNRFF